MLDKEANREDVKNAMTDIHAMLDDKPYNYQSIFEALMKVAYEYKSMADKFARNSSIKELTNFNKALQEESKADLLEESADRLFELVSQRTMQPSKDD